MYVKTIELFLESVNQTVILKTTMYYLLLNYVRCFACGWACRLESL